LLRPLEDTVMYLRELATENYIQPKLPYVPLQVR
jgi:hypothetical protein